MPSWTCFLLASVVCLVLQKALAAAFCNTSDSNLQFPSALNSFGENLYAAVLDLGGEPSSGGTFLSPFGASQALGMLLNGVELGGESSSQLQAVVLGRGPEDQLGLEEINLEMSQLAEVLLEVPPNSPLNVTNANSAWVDAGYQLQPGFQQALRQYFDAEVRTISTAQAVNSWVGQATAGRIDRIVDQDTLDEAAVLLINALYFKGLWEAPFEKGVTSPAPFRQLNGSTLVTAMMRKEVMGRERSAVQVSRFEAGGGRGDSVPCVAARLAYQGGEYSAVFAMPEGEVASSGPLRLLSPSLGYRQALSACRAQMLRVIQDLEFLTVSDSLILLLPKFEVEYETSLKAPLRQLGLTRPFDSSGGSDLTAVVTLNGSPATDLYVSDVLQKVFVKVDELGTEAAAVTSVSVMPTSAPLDPPNALEFNRPFAAAVVHNPSAAVLFAGEVVAPQAWSSAGD